MQQMKVDALRHKEAELRRTREIAQLRKVPIDSLQFVVVDCHRLPFSGFAVDAAFGSSDSVSFWGTAEGNTATK